MYKLDGEKGGERDPLAMMASSVAASMAEGDGNPELMRAWRWKDRFPQGDQYCLNWEEPPAA